MMYLAKFTLKINRVILAYAGIHGVFLFSLSLDSYCHGDDMLNINSQGALTL